ncbi:MAG: potassium-transporting ATPase subunit KdpC [Devosia sp.]|jgi:K+-transporting ATPase ATPase C chain
MLSNLRPAITLLLAFTLLTGIAYPLAMTGAAQALFPKEANGSLIEEDGKVIGSALIGQAFETDRYFHGRPSAVGYDASTSSGSNYGPSSAKLLDDIKTRAAAYGGGKLPADLVTASGSGLDPDLSPEAALVQVPRIAAARGLTEDQVGALVAEHVQAPDLGILGAQRVNVLTLNRALDTLKP